MVSTDSPSAQTASQPKGYHSALVTLHWLVAVLVLVNLYLGFFELQPGRGGNFQNERLFVAIHMATGIAILALVVVRFFVRTFPKQPPEASAGNRFLDLLAKFVHYALYFFLLAITVIGLTFALQTRRLQSAFFGGGAGPQFGAPPAGFRPPANNPGGQFPGANPGQGFPGGRFPEGGFRLPLLSLHLLTAYALLFLISLHVLAALYHQFILRDSLLGRMWFGR